MATAGDQINRALRMLGVLAEGETPSAETSADALVALNQMLDSWDTESLSVYTTQDQQFTWTAGSRVLTIGPSGDIVAERPVLVDDATYFVYNGISYSLDQVSQQQYDSIALKTSASTIPSVMYVAPDYPNISIYLYPVPSTALAFHLVSATLLSQPASLTTDLAFPPGYLRAFAANLACEIAPEFGIEPPASVKRMAMTSKRNLKRVNQPDDVMYMPSFLINTFPRGNIYTGWQ